MTRAEARRFLRFAFFFRGGGGAEAGVSWCRFTVTLWSFASRTISNYFHIEMTRHANLSLQDYQGEASIRSKHGLGKMKSFDFENVSSICVFAVGI